MSKRTDAIGLFWQDLPVVKAGSKRGPRERGSIPPIPETGWRTPTEFPNLSAAKVIGFDTETWDPELNSAGPGFGRGRGHIIGASLAVEDGTSWYFPMRHGIENGEQVLPATEVAHNMDPAQVLRYLQHVLGDYRPKVGANLIYDVGWLAHEGVKVRGPLYDIQFAEALLNSETPKVDLDSLSNRYLGTGKVTNDLYEWLSHWCGGRATERQRANLYLSPPSLAGPYAEADAALPVAILAKQWEAMHRRGVLELFDIECRLIPLLVAMRIKGAPVDLERTQHIYDDLSNDLVIMEKQLLDIAGQPVNPNARDSMTSAFNKLGIPIPTKIDTKTKERKVSFDAPRLEAIDHPLAAAVLEHKRTTKVRDVFVKSYIMDKNINGRVHCSFHPLKNDGGGARSGRFSSSDPNLQNIPVRTEIGKKVRTCFKGAGIWRKADYSQIEYRMLAHHAVGEGADELRLEYNQHPDTDFHVRTTELIARLTGVQMDRRPVKNINFGLIYGMSELKLIGDLGLSKAGGKELFANYHTAAPYIKETMDAAVQEVHRMGYVETILGRKSDFTSWGKKGYDKERRSLSYEAAIDKWGTYGIERANTHKALNRKLQGGAADVMKKAMVEAYEAGLFSEDACGIPLLTVHDELDFDDVNDPNGPWWAEFKRVMENAVPQIKVPVMIDISAGPSWGEAD